MLESLKASHEKLIFHFIDTYIGYFMACLIGKILPENDIINHTYLGPGQNKLRGNAFYIS